MLQELISYGNTGDENCLVKILKGIVEMSGYGQVPAVVMDKVIPRFVKVFRTSDQNDKRHLAWSAMTALSDPSRNTAATLFKRKLEEQYVLDFATKSCKQYPETECIASLIFLSVFCAGDERRQLMIMTRLTLLTELLAVLDLSVADGHYRAVQLVLTTLVSLFQSKGPVAVFIKAGGFGKLNSAIDSLVSRGVAEFNGTGHVGEELSSIIGQLLTTNSKYQEAAWRDMRYCSLTAPADMPTYCYYAEGARRHTQLLHSALDILPEGPSYNTIVGHFYMTYIYLLAFTIADDSATDEDDQPRSEVSYNAVEYYMLSPGAISGLSMLVRCMRKLRSVDNLDGEPSSKLLENLDTVGLKYPAVLAALEAELGEKFVHCSMPECCVSNLKRHRLKKCVQCLSVWYCSKEHQVAHWKAHKQECKLRAAALSTSEHA